MHNDLSSFSRNDFHATTWINKLIQEIPEGENVESIISSMSMKLHMAAQDYSEQLETAMVESMSTMPRMVSEISRLQDQLKSMQDEMRVISEHIHSVDQRSVSGVEELSRLDHIKSNMDKCRSTLQEHARWSLLVREARLLLEGSGELAETADRIQVMHNSLEILRNLPGHEERKDTYETFRSTLLNALTPNIRKEINDMSITTLQEYLYVYRKLHSYEDFVKEYIRNRPAAIINIWKTENSSSHQSFSEWFALFLGTVTKFLLDEENNIIELFGSDVAPTIENNMLKEILSDMKLQLSEKLQQKQQEEEKNKNNSTTNTMTAYECYCLLDEFMKRISFLLIKLTIIQRIDLFSFIFSSFQSYLPSYLLYDEKIMKERLLLNIQSISFQPQELLTTNKPNNNINNNNNNNTFLGEDSMDELEQLNQFLESSSNAITDSFQYFNERLQYCSKIFGGSLLIREFSKYFIHSLLLFIKSMTLKFHCFAIALGIEKDMTTTSDISSSSSSESSNSYGNYLDEVKQAQRIATKLLATTEYDTQMFSLNVLKSLQLLGQFLKFISQLENQYRMICSEIQKNMIVLEGYFPNDIEGMMKKSLSFGHVYGSYYMIHHDQHLAELKSFLSNNAVVSSIGGNSASYSQGIFATITQPLKKLKIRIGNTLISLANQIPMKLMTSYSHEEILTRVIQNEEELEIAKMNLLPQTSITQVGEHMLSWVQDLESFASSDAFQDLLILRGETLQLLPLSLGWSSFRSLIEINDEKLLSQLTERVSCAKLINAFERELIQTARSQGITLSEFLQRINDPQSSGLDTLETDLLNTGDVSNPGEVGVEGGNTLIFVNEWLSVIADSIVAIYLTTILRLSTISEIGALQLLTDIDYLSNVVNAVGIRPHPLLVFTRSLLIEERQPLTQCLQSLTGSGKSLGALKDLLKYSNLINQNLINKKK